MLFQHVSTLNFSAHPNVMSFKLQIAPECAPRVTIVISPLRSLMKDQVHRCRANNIRACQITNVADMSDDDKSSKYLAYHVRTLEF